MLGLIFMHILYSEVFFNSPSDDLSIDCSLSYQLLLRGSSVEVVRHPSFWNGMCRGGCVVLFTAGWDGYVQEAAFWVMRLGM